jgi:ribosomal protein L11 methyltransferase
MPDKNCIEARILVPWAMQEEASLFLMDLSGRDVIVENDPQPEGGALIHALFESGDMGASEREDLERFLHRLGSYGLHPLGMELRSVTDREWTEECRARSRIRRVGSLWALGAPWMEYEARPGEKVIILDGGGAFGSGRHPSTILSLTALEQAWRSGLLPAPTPGWKALDVGTGTGILAIAAAHLGAEVLAIDIDDRAVAAAENNLRLNGMQDRVKVEETPLGLVNGRFQLVLANIAFPEQLELAATINRLMLPGCVAIVSGFLHGDADTLAGRHGREGLRCEARLSHGDWLSMILRLPAPPGCGLQGSDDRSISNVE